MLTTPLSNTLNLIIYNSLKSLQTLFKPTDVQFNSFDGTCHQSKPDPVNSDAADINQMFVSISPENT